MTHLRHLRSHLPPSKVDVGKYDVVKVGVGDLVTFDLVEVVERGGLVGETFAQVDQRFKPRYVLDEPLYAIIDRLTAGNDELPVARLKQKQLPASFFEQVSDVRVLRPGQLVCHPAEQGLATVLDVPHPVDLVVG